MSVRVCRLGFTLIEILVVLVILAILASITVPMLTSRPSDAKRKTTIIEISMLKTTLNTFYLDNSRYPTTAEGLAVLVECPPELSGTWKGPYLERIPVDKWDHAYRYASPTGDTARPFDLMSLGEDGLEGTADDITPLTLK